MMHGFWLIKENENVFVCLFFFGYMFVWIILLDIFFLLNLGLNVEF